MAAADKGTEAGTLAARSMTAVKRLFGKRGNDDQSNRNEEESFGVDLDWVSRQVVAWSMAANEQPGNNKARTPPQDNGIKRMSVAAHGHTICYPFKTFKIYLLVVVFGFKSIQPEIGLRPRTPTKRMGNNERFGGETGHSSRSIFAANIAS